MKPAKFGDGFIAQHAENMAEVVDDTSVTIATIKLFHNGRAGILWAAPLFSDALAMPDELREMLVRQLRLHADKLESREMDARMKELVGKQGGEA